MLYQPLQDELDNANSYRDLRMIQKLDDTYTVPTDFQQHSLTPQTPTWLHRTTERLNTLGTSFIPSHYHAPTLLWLTPQMVRSITAAEIRPQHCTIGSSARQKQSNKMYRCIGAYHDLQLLP